jgi:hypothetical protein
VSMILAGLILSVIGLAAIDLSGHREDADESATSIRLPPVAAVRETRSPSPAEAAAGPSRDAGPRSAPVTSPSAGSGELVTAAPRRSAKADSGEAPSEQPVNAPAAAGDAELESAAAADGRLAGTTGPRSAAGSATPLGSNAWSPLLDAATSARRAPVRELGLADVVRRMLRLSSPDEIAIA